MKKMKIANVNTGFTYYNFKIKFFMTFVSLVVAQVFLMTT
jgi:hypothetical protein